MRRETVGDPYLWSRIVIYFGLFGRSLAIVFEHARNYRSDRRTRVEPRVMELCN